MRRLCIRADRLPVSISRYTSAAPPFQSNHLIVANRDSFARENTLKTWAGSHSSFEALLFFSCPEHPCKSLIFA